MVYQPVAGRSRAAMANPIQQGLKHRLIQGSVNQLILPQWLIQYNKD